MLTLEIPVPPGLADSVVPAAVLQVCGDAGLRVTLDGTQKSYPGSRHWHYQLGRQPGTLEVTWWPARRRLWLKVAAGRASTAIMDMLPRVQAALTEAMQVLPVVVATLS